MDETLGRDRSGDLLRRLIAESVEAFRAGQTIDRAQILASYPELADSLKSFFENLDRDPDSLGIDSQKLASATGAIVGGNVLTLSPHGTVVGDIVNSRLAAEPSTLPKGYFGDYELLTEIARGGMGVVYKARQRKLNRIVALKMILAGKLAAAEDVQRFYTEAEAAANLDHPGIVPIYEVGELEGQHYFSMGFVDGTSLAAKLREGPMQPAMAAELIQKIAEAVRFAHEHGVIHRDLKPANILLDQHQQPRITDFGLAKQVRNQSNLTESGQILGTPSYMPPEQAAGNIESIGPRSDVYSIGAILYAQLTGKPPFAAASMIDTLMQVLEREPIPPKTLNPKIPTDLDTICLKCLQKDPNRRYVSAQELSADLGRFLHGEPVLARPIGSLERAIKWARRRPATAALCGLVVLVTLLGVAGIGWQWWRAEHSAHTARKLATVAQEERDDAQQARDETKKLAIVAQQERDDAQRARDEAKRELRRSLLVQSRAGRFSGQPGRRFQGLDALERAAQIEPGPDLRDEAIACLALADVRVARAIRFAQPAPPGVVATFDARLERYARFDAKGAITLHDAQNDRVLAELPGPGIPIEWLLRFSPDGKYLAAKHEQKEEALFQVWDIANRQVVYKTTLAVSLAAVDFHPTSAQVALVDTARTLHLVDLPSGMQTRQWQLDTLPYTISFHPSGKLLAVSNHLDKQVVLFDTQEGKATGRLAHPAGVRGMSWGPEGRLLATACGDSKAYIWDVPRRQVVAVLEGHTNVVTTVVFNRQGSLLASYGWDGETRFWDPRLGTQLVHIPGEVIQFSQFSPDDTRLGYVVSAREIGIWQVAPGLEFRTLGVAAGQAPYLIFARFSHDDRLLTTASSEGLRIWDLADNREVHFQPHSGLVAAQFGSGDKSLILSDFRGVSRWPVERQDDDDATRMLLRSQPPLPNSFAPQSCAHSGDGTLLAVARANQVEVYAADAADGSLTRLFVGPHVNAASVSISPDGRWVASGTWKGTGVKVWNVAGKSLERELLIQGNANVGFSPDGKYLGTSAGHNYCLWSVPDWSPRLEIAREQGSDVPGNICFSGNGKMWAVLVGRSAGLRLLATEDSQTLAELESGMQLPLCFSHDGTMLAVRGDKGRVHLWNLPLLREQLTRFRVPTDALPLATRPDNSPAATKPLLVELDTP